MKHPQIIGNRICIVVDTDGVEHRCEYSLNQPRRAGGLQTLNVTAPPGFMIVEAIGGAMQLVKVQAAYVPEPPQMY